MKMNLKYKLYVTKLVRSLMSATVHAQQGNDHSPPTNTYLLYAMPLKSLPVLIYEEILGCKVNKKAIIIPSTHPYLEHPEME